MTTPLVDLHAIEKRFGTTVTAAGVSLTLNKGEFFTLLGPSGSGKSTILRMIAGLERPDSGRILVANKDVTNLPPWRRGLGMVFQNYAVFPHLSVGQNVGYGLRRLNMPREARKNRVRELLTLVGLSGFNDRHPQQLSGGEQQRVAIARALAPRPEVLLLDEPLSALDEKIRREMQTELRRIQQTTRTTFVYVTHDQEEALTMSDRIAVLDYGYVVQCDDPEHIFKRPTTPFVARFFRGCNVLKTIQDPTTGRYRIGDVLLPIEPRTKAAAGSTHLMIAIRAENVRLNADAPARALVFGAILEAATYRGLYTDYRLRLMDGQTLSAIDQRHREIEPETPVKIAVAPEDVIPLEHDRSAPHPN